MDQVFAGIYLLQKLKCIKKFSLRAQVGSMARTKFLPIIPTNRRTPTTQRIRRSNKPAKTSSSLSMNDLNFHSGLSQVDKYYTRYYTGTQNWYGITIDVYFLLPH